MFAIIMALSLFTTSCSESTDTVTTPHYTEVSLTLDFPLNNRNEPSRGFVNGTPEYDETTELQQIISEGDICILGFQHDKLAVYKCNVSSIKSNGFIQLKFRLDSSKFLDEQIEFAVLTNLSNNVQQNIPNLLSHCIGFSSQQVYEKLIFPFTGEWDISKRYIPMWGITPPVTLKPGTNHLRLSCPLYRAVAKVGFRVNVDPQTQQAWGYSSEMLRISKIVVKGALNQGYAAPLSHTNEYLSHATFIKPFIPGSATPLTAEAIYTNKSQESYTCEFINHIYLPEQNTVRHSLSFEIYYSLQQKEQQPKIVNFPPEEHIIRNHSYIYNLRLSSNQELLADYKIMPWRNCEPIEFPFN